MHMVGKAKQSGNQTHDLGIVSAMLVQSKVCVLGKPLVCVCTVSSTWWGAVNALRRRIGCWNSCRGWSLRTASPPGVNRCCMRSTPPPITPPLPRMVRRLSFRICTHQPFSHLGCSIFKKKNIFFDYICRGCRLFCNIINVKLFKIHPSVCENKQKTCLQ